MGLNKKYCSDLQMAIIQRDLNGIKSLISCHNVDVNCIKLLNGSTPLSFAIYGNLCEVVKVLLAMGCDTNRCSNDHLGRIEPPLCSAVRIGNTIIVRSLLDVPHIDVNQTDFFGQTPLWLAVKARRFDLLSLILDHHSFRLNANSFIMRDSNPLYLASKYLNKGRLQMVKALIKCGFRVDAESFAWILKHNDESVIKMVLNADNNPVFRKQLNIMSPLSLLKLTRIAIRDIFIAHTNCVINLKTLKIHFSSLPDSLIEFIVNLEE